MLKAYQCYYFIYIEMIYRCPDITYAKEIRKAKVRLETSIIFRKEF